MELGRVDGALGRGMLCRRSVPPMLQPSPPSTTIEILSGSSFNLVLLHFSK